MKLISQHLPVDRQCFVGIPVSNIMMSQTVNNQLTCKPLIFEVCQYYIYNTERKANKSIIQKGTPSPGVCVGGGGRGGGGGGEVS